MILPCSRQSKKQRDEVVSGRGTRGILRHSTTVPALSTRVERFDGPPTEWDDAVRRFGDWTHFHLIGWKQVVESVFGHECPYLVARDQSDTIRGLLPLVRVRSRLFGHFLVSMPFLNYGGPLGETEAVTALVDTAIDMAKRDAVDLLELRSGQPLDIDLPASHRKITSVLDLPEEDPDLLWNGSTTKMRTKIRRPQKAGVTVRFGPDQLGAFFGIFSHHMRDLGTPTQSRGFFEEVARTFPNSTWFACAYHQGRAVAGGCGFTWGREFEMTWSAGLKSDRRLRPNLQLYWSLMERAVTEGLRAYNFGRSTPGGGTHEFKRQWGARDVPLWWYQYAPGAAKQTPSPDDPTFSWGPRLWKHLPVPIATALGPRIVRYIP